VPSATSVPVPAAPILREETPGTVSAEKSLKKVNDLMVALCAGGDLKEFLGKVLDDILDVISGETAFFLFLQGESLTVEVGRLASGKAAGDPEHTICLPLIENACANKRPLFLADMADDMDAARELEKQGIACSSLAIATFRIETGREGVLYVLNPQLQKGGDEASLWVLKPFLNLASIAYRQLCPEALPAP